jgi:transcriptional regulator with XRE-family HTH domain
MQGPEVKPKMSYISFFDSSDLEKIKVKKAQFLTNKIVEVMDSKGLSKSAFAQLMNVQPSVVTKWLSGSHNFTIETLFEIEQKLGIDLFAIPDRKKEQSIKLHTTAHANVPVSLPGLDRSELIDTAPNNIRIL